MKTKILLFIAGSTFYFLLFAVMVSLVEPCFSQNYQWVKHIGSSVNDEACSATDKYGNVYLYCRGANNPPPQNPPLPYDNNVPFYTLTDTLPPIHQQNIYLLKLDNNGNQLFAKQFSWTTYGQCGAGQQLVYDSLNDVIYIYGTFKGTITLGAFQLVTSDIDIFIAQFDLAGNCLWAKKAGSSGNVDFITAMSTDKSGNVYICGLNDDNTIFDSFTVPSGCFMAKYNLNGDCLWAVKKFNHSAGAIPKSIKIVDSTMFVTGCGRGLLEIDTMSTVYSTNRYSYIAAFDLDGHVKKLKTFGEYSSATGGIGIDSTGNLYIVGYITTGTAYFDSIAVSGGSVGNAFIAKLDKNWNFKWVSQTYSSNAITLGMFTDKIGISYFTGNFNGNASFGIYNVSTTTSSSSSMFLTRYDANGVCMGVLHSGGINSGSSVSADNAGNPVVVGTWFSGSIGSTTFTSYGGGSDIFIAKANPITTGVNNLRIAQENNLLTIYANPNEGKCNITVPEEFQNEKNLVLKIFDAKGNQIQQAQVEMLGDKIKVNIEVEAKGIYNVVLTNGKKNYSGRIIFE